jgi:hypothetical protein
MATWTGVRPASRRLNTRVSRWSFTAPSSNILLDCSTNECTSRDIAARFFYFMQDRFSEGNTYFLCLIPCCTLHTSTLYYTAAFKHIIFYYTCAWLLLSLHRAMLSLAILKKRDVVPITPTLLVSSVLPSVLNILSCELKT